MTDAENENTQIAQNETVSLYRFKEDEIWNEVNEPILIGRFNGIESVISSKTITVLANYQNQEFYAVDSKNDVSFQKMDHNIKIRKICSGFYSSFIFYISGDNKLYISRNNDTPFLCENIQNVIDVAYYTSTENNQIFILCNIWTSIKMFHATSGYIRTAYNQRFGYYSYDIPNDIIIAINKYLQFTQLLNGVINRKDDIINNPKFERIPLPNINIIKISAGHEDVLFLAEDGTVWIKELQKDIHQMSYFRDNNVKIIDIECGSNCNIATDCNDTMYGWGYSECGECGVQSQSNVVQTPTPINKYLFHNKKVKHIECGNMVTYIATEDGQHFIFGHVGHVSCCLFPPYSINHKFGNKQKIKSVHLGDDECKYQIIVIVEEENMNEKL